MSEDTRTLEDITPKVEWGSALARKAYRKTLLTTISRLRTDAAHLALGCFEAVDAMEHER